MTYSRFPIEPKDTREEFEQLRCDNLHLKQMLDEALTELARWKVECLERRKLMVKAQNDSLVRAKHSSDLLG